MGLSKFNKNVQNITVLSDNPNEGNDPLSSMQLKEKFDAAGVDIKNYINNTLTSEIDATVTNINESISDLETDVDNIGDLSNLNTTDRTKIVNAINEILNDIYYKTGDTFTLQNGFYVTDGFCSGSTKTINFNISFPKSIKNISGFTIPTTAEGLQYAASARIRTSDGGYVDNESETGRINNRRYNCSISKISDNTINVTLTRGDGNAFNNVTNNTVVSVQIDTLNINFS